MVVTAVVYHITAMLANRTTMEDDLILPKTFRDFFFLQILFLTDLLIHTLSLTCADLQGEAAPSRKTNSVLLLKVLVSRCV